MKQNASLVIATMLLACVISKAETPQSPSDFSNQYQRAETPTERRELCVQAIDHGLIARGIPVEKLVAMFGIKPGAWGRSRFEPIKNDEFAIHFDSFQGNEIPGDWPGWYLFIRYDSKDRVIVYFLSNDRILLLPIKVAPDQ